MRKRENDEIAIVFRFPANGLKSRRLTCSELCFCPVTVLVPLAPIADKSEMARGYI
jgi:hypothetical protein